MAKSRGKEDRVAHEKAYAKLQRELSRTGFLWVGTVLRQYHVCGKPGCRCRRGGRFRHGPYSVWTRKIRGKTVTRMLSEEEGRLYMTWIENRRRPDRTIDRMLKISKLVARLMLSQRSSR